METTKQLSEAAWQYLHDTIVGVAAVVIVLIMPSFTRRQIDNSELGADVIPTLQLRTALVRHNSAQWAIEGYSVVVG